MQSEKGTAVSCACIKSTYKFIPCVCVCYGYCGKDKTSIHVAWWLWLNRRLMISCCHFGQIDGPNALRNAIVQAICIHQHLVERVTRTPTNQDVPPEVFLLREEGNSEQSVQIEPLHQEPEETRHDAILEEHHHYLAAHLQGRQNVRGLIQSHGMLVNTVLMQNKQQKQVYCQYMRQHWEYSWLNYSRANFGDSLIRKQYFKLGSSVISSSRG